MIKPITSAGYAPEGFTMADTPVTPLSEAVIQRVQEKAWELISPFFARASLQTRAEVQYELCKQVRALSEDGVYAAGVVLGKSVAIILNQNETLPEWH